METDAYLDARDAAETAYYAFVATLNPDLVDEAADFENARDGAPVGSLDYWQIALASAEMAAQFRADERGLSSIFAR